ncbi:RDD family protein [Bacillus sp. Bva_UNVM-123]|uniref:RDD family protein n=1 Tax=Bacillus sp. Bva_UNVM-123 TaxID=2829798 RepID=UPI00391EECF0
MNQDNVGIKTPEYVSLQFQIAGLGSRTAAFIIDQIILAIINIVILIAYFVIMIGSPSNFFISTDIESFTLAIIIIAIFIINWGYFFAYEYFSGGRTIGKKMIGIRVIQDNGHSITLLSSFIRNLLRIIDSLPVNYFVGILMVFFHSKHKRLGDLVAGTIVVHERKAKKNNKKKLNDFDKELMKRGISKDDLVLEEWALKSLGIRDWNLLNTYSHRFLQLHDAERKQITKEIAEMIFPKINIQFHGKNEYELENLVLALYLNAKEEWEYEL